MREVCAVLFWCWGVAGLGWFGFLFATDRVDYGSPQLLAWLALWIGGELMFGLGGLMFPPSAGSASTHSERGL
jgi:hypothetical protein